MKKLFITFLVLALHSLVYSIEDRRNTTKVGLVLSGGGAKGIAHVGVLKVLEQAGIQVDVVTGTSMGSIIGGLYAIGYDAQSIEKIILGQNWVSLFNDKTERRHISILEKDLSSRYVGGFPLYKRKINLPTGLLAGQNVSALLSRLTWPVYDVDNFDNFQRPFRCVATDIETGDAVVFKSGYLPEAIRASMAIPSVFTPVEHNGKLLIDGGLTRNLPVQEALDMGANFIIAVDVGNPLYPKEQLYSLAKILTQAINFRIVASTKEQEKLCNILIRPAIEEYTIADFFEADSLIARGESAARIILPQLQHLADSLRLYQSAKTFFPPAQLDSFYVSDIKIIGLNKVSRQLVEAKIALDVPQTISPAELEKIIDRLYGSLYFERVTCQFETQEIGVRLIIRVVEKVVNRLNFGLNYSTQHDAGILLNATFRNLMGHGTKLSIDSRLGHSREFGGNYFYHTNIRPGFGVGVDIRAKEYDFDLFKNNVRVSRFNYYSLTSDINLLTTVSNAVTFGFIGQRQKTIQSPIVTSVELGEKDLISDYFSLAALFKIDTQDHAYFPTNGLKFYLNVKRHYILNPSDQKNNNFERYFINYKQAHKLSKCAINFSLINGYTNGSEIPREQLFHLGGYYYFEDYMFPVTGLEFMQVAQKNVFVAKIGILTELFPQNFIELELYKSYWNDSYQYLFSDGNSTWSGGVAYGLNTPLGPIKATVAANNMDKKFIGYLTIGYWF